VSERGEKDIVLVIYMNSGAQNLLVLRNDPIHDVSFGFSVFAWPAERSGTTNADIMAMGKTEGS